ncbi:M3 family metallopeptidase [Sphingomonas sp.]|uniref:M3 family metallopeptidase n=1 Tax=Sphingomonas sp. TaxID=28214 RepID=UPI00286B8C99|nr:M3 family metallopeptidase [Sphingomonas sp.]
MKRMVLATGALMALGGCATGKPYSGVEAGPALVAESPAPAVAPVTIPMPDNVLLADWSGPYGGVPPWDRVKPSQFPEALQFAVEEQRREIAAIADNAEAPTFDNSIVALEKAGQRLNRVGTIYGLYSNNLSSPEFQKIREEWDPKLSAASDEVTLNPKLFQRIKAVYDTRAGLGLDAKQLRLVEKIYEGYVRNGANLAPADKEQLATINQQLARAFGSFSDKLLADEEKHTVATVAELNGLPKDVQSAAKAAAAERHLAAGSYAIVNTRSSVDPVLTYADNRALREKVWREFVNRGDNGDANDTNATIAQIVELRADRARLLGFSSHAAWRMQDTMAKTPDKAMDLMMRVWPAAVAREKEEVADMAALAHKSGFKGRIEPWDYLYYAEKVRKARYDLSQEELKPYFQLDNMIQAMFWSAGELYGYDFKENTGTVPVFHPDVRTFEVTDRKDGHIVGEYYLDTFARSGKRSGAWHEAYRPRARLLGDTIVLNSNNNNFTKPAPGEPVLISLDDANTMFHEFGHALHYLTLDVNYPTFAGSQRDFVEYPSQVNENWLLTPQVLNRFAKHYQTGQPIPQALVDKIEKANRFNQGYATVSYLSSALVDMKLHLKADGVVDPDAFERETLAELGMPREMVMRHRLPQFGHLFQSDSYSAGYYSYLWSEVMDADTWAAFEAAGNVWDKTIASRFKSIILQTGNETDRAEAYRAFRGRDPDVTALLKRRGFPTN